MKAPTWEGAIFSFAALLFLGLSTLAVLESAARSSAAATMSETTVPASVVHAIIPSHLASCVARTNTGDLEVFILPADYRPDPGDEIDWLGWCRRHAAHVATIEASGGAWIFWEGAWRKANERTVRAAAGLTGGSP